MNFFGLFKSVKLTPLEELKKLWEQFTQLLEVPSTKQKLSDFETVIDKMAKILLDEDEKSVYETTEVMTFFLENNIYNYFVANANMDVPKGIRNVVIKNTTSLIKSLRTTKFLGNSYIINSLKSLIHEIDNEIKIGMAPYNRKVLITSLLYELCKKFFAFPEILKSLIINVKQLNESSNEILIFSLLLNIFKTDQLFKEYECKKMIRRSLIVCLSFEEINGSVYLERESYICEILIEKFVAYYQMLPFYIDLCEDLVTLDLAYNIKNTFPIVLNTYFEFRDYLIFFNKVCNTMRSHTLNNKLKIIFFNSFLLPYVQPGIIYRRTLY